MSQSSIDAEALIAAAETGDMELAHRLASQADAETLSSAIWRACFAGSVSCVQFLGKDVFDLVGEVAQSRLPKFLFNHPSGPHAEAVLKLVSPWLVKPALKNLLEVAAAYGSEECLEMGLSLADPETDLSTSMKEAAERGNFQCVKRLLMASGSVVSDHRYAIYSSADYNQPACLSLLLDHQKSADDGDILLEAMERASEKGHLECVKILLPRCISLKMESGPLVAAALNKHIDCLRVLAPVDEVYVTDAAKKLLAEGHISAIEALSPWLSVDMLFQAAHQILPNIMSQLQLEMLNSQTSGCSVERQKRLERL